MFLPEGDRARAEASMICRPQLYSRNDDTQYGIGSFTGRKVNHNNAVEPTGQKAIHYELDVRFKTIEAMGQNIFELTSARAGAQVPTIAIDGANAARVQREDIGAGTGGKNVLAALPEYRRNAIAQVR